MRIIKVPINRADILCTIFKVGTDKSGPRPLDHSYIIEVIIYNTVGTRKNPKGQTDVYNI